MLFTDRGKAAYHANGRPGVILDCGGSLKIEVLKNEVMIGLRNFSERGKVAQANERSSQGAIRSLEKRIKKKVN